MRHPYDLRSSERGRRSAPVTNEPTPVTWIVAILFSLIFITAFGVPIISHLLGQVK